MPNEITSTYTLLGSSVEQFKNDFNELGTIPDTEEFCEKFELPTARFYFEDNCLDENPPTLTCWEAWYPHTEEIWDVLCDKYEDLQYYVYCYDNDNWECGFVNTDYEGQYNKTRYRALWTECDWWNDDYFNTLEEAMECIEGSAEEYIIQKAWDEVELFNEPMEIVAQSPDLSDEFKETFGLYNL